MLDGARERFPDHRIHVETLDPEAGECNETDTTDSDEALEPYRAAIAGIERGEFGARPHVRRCHTCPFYFVCGA